jgi:UDP-glucose 4-epimerase
MKTILVVGGAGYIGSHTVVELMEFGYKCVVLDNLSEGHRKAVKTEFFELADLEDREAIAHIFDKYTICGVIHFSSFIEVGESVKNPSKFYRNNVANTLNLLDVMVEKGVKNIVFSSTCAIYGNPEYSPLDELHPQAPLSPYGKTKQMVEKILEDYGTAYGLKYISLRYFNASGASENGELGESHNVETHLIPIVLKTLTGERKGVNIFGTDYDTPDGTCVRDYIHVSDLASAHRLAMESLLGGGDSDFINLGTGIGHSVREIITACERVTGKKVPVIEAERRAGDPPELVAANEKAKRALGWRPKYTNIDDIIRTAWFWEQNKKF